MTQRRRINISVSTQLWKEFCRKALELDKTRSAVLEELINRFLKK